MKITLSHLRAAKFCMRGVRAWTEANNIDYYKLRSEGIDIEEVEHINDPYITKLLEIIKNG